MAASFPGYPKEGLTFLRQLAKNNTREWFRKNKSTYETAVKAPTVALVEALNTKLESFAPDYVADPKKAIFRQHRDTRFSKDRTPYKTHVSAVFPCQGAPKNECAGFYFAVSPTRVDVLGGIHMPGPDQIKALRAHLDGDHKAFQKLVSARGVRNAMGDMQGEQLKRVPRGYDTERPAGDLLRYKQVYFQTTLKPAVATTPELFKEMVKKFRAMTPFVTYLDNVLAGVRT